MNYATEQRTGYAVGANAPAAVATALPVASAVSDLEGNVTHLHDTVAALAERLGAVLGSPQPQPGNATKGPDALPTLANRIYSLSGGVHSATMRLQDILTRLEL
jgi:hypothetical protein